MKQTFYCPKCGLKLDKLHYILGVGGIKHLAGYCKLHKTIFVNKVENLKIPTQFSKKMQQPKLF